MTAQKGSAFLLKISDGAEPPVYRTVAGLRTTQMSIAGDSVVVTSKDSAGWRELLSGAGVRSVSVTAAGLFLGSLAYGRWGRQKNHVETIFRCLIAGGLVTAAFAFGVEQYRNVWVAQALAVSLGFVVGPIVIAANTVVHKFASSAMQGKVFSAMEVVIHFGFLVTMLASSKLSEFVEPYWILAGVGLVFCLVGVWGMVRYRQGKLAIEG